MDTFGYLLLIKMSLGNYTRWKKMGLNKKIFLLINSREKILNENNTRHYSES